MSKVLLFSNYHFDNYQGGPSGFIKQNILGYDIKNLVTLQTLQLNNKSSRIGKAIKKVSNKYFSLLNEKKNRSWLEDFTLSAGKEFKRLKCYQFKYIYFHDIFSLYGCLSYIQKDQQVILQSHAPQLVSEEFRNLNYADKDLIFIQEIERLSFAKANILIFPNIGAKEIYNTIISPMSRIVYIISASRAIVNACKLPLNNSINILFIGRRNQIKGFDILIESFIELRKSRKDINLLIAGDGESIDQEGIITLGHINPDNWIVSVDYVINVNRNSYFDLSVMEVLSIGTPIILALTGGHTFFKNKSEGIIEIERLDVKNLTCILKNLRKLSSEERDYNITQNRLLYNEYFTSELYRDRLDKFIKTLQ